MYCYIKYLLLLTFVLCSIASCSSFSYLTDITESPQRRPAASACGSCHEAQFSEWSLSRHALAFTNKVFQKEYLEASDTDCLVCHAPVSIRQENVTGRSFNLAEGVDCISCHYSDGKMHGPHGSSALFQPHPVVGKDAFYLEISLCAVCHGETADEYKETARTQVLPTCLKCHAAPTKRTISQGTGVFSELLVSFEKPVNSRNHTISLDALDYQQDTFLSTPTFVDTGKGQLIIEITNPLPHNLPTGTYGQKSVRLLVAFFREEKKITEDILPVSDETDPLLPGAVKRISYPLPASVQQGDRMLIDLKRFAAPNDSRAAVALASKSFALPFSDL